MTHIAKSTTINAPIDRVFGIIDDPARTTELNPDLKLLSHRPASAGGYDNEWEFNMGGMKFTGQTKVKEYQKPNRVVLETTGGIPSNWQWTFTPEGSSTRASVTLDYTVPGSLLGVVADKLIIERQNDQVVDRLLTNLKRIAESA